MKIESFSDFFSSIKESSHKDGTYVGVRLSPESIEKIQQIQQALNVSDPVPVESLHATVLFSRNPIDIEPSQTQYFGTSTAIDTFGDGKNTVVLKVNSPSLCQRHDVLISMGGTHDYLDYQCHVTLAYSNDKPIVCKYRGVDLIFVDEYVDPLDLDWSA